MRDGPSTWALLRLAPRALLSRRGRGALGRLLLLAWRERRRGRARTEAASRALRMLYGEEAGAAGSEEQAALWRRFEGEVGAGGFDAAGPRREAAAGGLRALVEARLAATNPSYPVDLP